MVRKSGNMEVNWKLLIMRFRMGNYLRTLKGDRVLHKSGVSLKAMMKALQQEGHRLRWNGRGLLTKLKQAEKNLNHRLEYIASYTNISRCLAYHRDYLQAVILTILFRYGEGEGEGGGGRESINVSVEIPNI